MLHRLQVLHSLAVQPCTTTVAGDADHRFHHCGTSAHLHTTQWISSFCDPFMAGAAFFSTLVPLILHVQFNVQQVLLVLHQTQATLNWLLQFLEGAGPHLL